MTPRPVVARREKHARQATVILSVVAVLLLVVSALALFDPSTRFPGFGFAMGQRVTRLNSDSPLILQGTEPPTSTVAQNGPTPTPTPNNGTGAQPTATTQPTATPIPTATPLPTATPILPANHATVTFNATTQNLNASPTYTSCPSGCDFPSRNGGNQIPGSFFKQYVSGYQSTRLGGPLSVTLKSLRTCFSNTGTCHGGGIWTGNTVTFSGGGLSASCSGYVPAMGLGQNATVSTNCYVSTRSGSVSVSGSNGGSVQDSSDPNVFYAGGFSWSNVNWGSTGGYYYPTQADCNYAVSQAYSSASGQAQSAINAFFNGYPSGPSSITQVNNYCSPAVGQPGGSVTGHSSAAWSAESFDPNTAVGAAGGRIRAMLPTGYVWRAGPTACSASSLFSASNHSWSGSTFTINCPASGTAAYDWNAGDPSGSQAVQNLQGKLKGQTLAAAQNLCNGSYPGVSPGSCTITLTGGNAQILPSDPTAIQIVAN